MALILNTLTLLASVLCANAQVNPGWQYGDDLIVKADPALMTIPLAPVSTVPNPLIPHLGKPVLLPASRLTGKFQELDERADRAVAGTDQRYFTDFNYRQITPNGVQYEFQYDTPSAVQSLYPYIKSLLQLDPTTTDMADQYLLSSNADPGRNYTCANDSTNQYKMCKMNTAVKRRRYIFGADDRTAVPTASRTNFPYRTVGIVGNHCTGTLVGPRHVLTAGHCVHSGPGGDWIADLGFSPAFDKDAGTKAPYGKIPWVRAVTTSAWAGSGSWNNDYAIIELQYDTGLGWMSFGYHSGINSGWNMNMNGYPGSTLWGKMHHHYGQLLSAGSNLQYRTIDMVKGTSGSGVYLYTASSGFRRIYGVNNVQYWVSGDAKAASDNYIAGHTSPSWNQAVRITSSRFSRICGWINDARIGC